jgi:chlorobactene glucosyltransferase
MVWVLLYALFVIGILLWGGVIGLRFKGSLWYEKPPDTLPLVSTIVPARNEERNIDRCARGLVQQDYPNLEMVFIDDDSIDATPKILAGYAEREPRIKVITTGGKPENWNGKQWACHSGAEVSKGNWLCFMDADTYAEPTLISKTLAFATAKNVDVLTLQPWYEMCGLWERIVLPIGLPPLLIVFPPERINNPSDKLSMANGQFILIRRDVYNAIEGHAGVKDRMMDDFSLAEIIKRAGYRIVVADGADVIRVRLYTNLREIWAGALKAAVEISGGWLTSVLGLFVNLLTNVLPVPLFIWSLFQQNTLVSLILGIVVAFEVVYYSFVRVVGFRLPPWSGITYPIGGLVVMGILLDGMIRLASGKDIKWKDRSLLGRPELPIKQG